MLRFISYGMKNEADGLSFVWELSSRGSTEDPLDGVLLQQGSSVGSSLNFNFSTCVTGDPMIEEKHWK